MEIVKNVKDHVFNAQLEHTKVMEYVFNVKITVKDAGKNNASNVIADIILLQENAIHKIVHKDITSPIYYAKNVSLFAKLALLYKPAQAVQFQNSLKMEIVLINVLKKHIMTIIALIVLHAIKIVKNVMENNRTTVNNV